MKGDFTRSTFKKKKHFHDVRMQQGRVQMDADWNEQLDITGHRVETETKDVVGLCGTPMHHGGFRIFTTLEKRVGLEKKLPDEFVSVIPNWGNLFISSGRMYVDGILCENEQSVHFTKQPDLPMPKSLRLDQPKPGISGEVISTDEPFMPPPSTKQIYLAYIDVWLRHITALEDPEIREKALGGPDTATRVKTVWQVKLFKVKGKTVNCLSVLPAWREYVKPVTGKLAAYTETVADEEKPCVLSPEGGYRRLENQLYRVEIHRGGELANGITFKWSRDNGTVVAKWEEQGQGANKNKLTVSSTGRDEVLNFKKGHWVELTDESRVLLGKPGILVQLEDVEGQVLTIDTDNIIDPDNSSATSVDINDFDDDPKVRLCRRWDSLGEITVDTPQEGIELEDGVMVEFSSGTYKTGDYWLVPARTVDADVEWPKDDSPEPQPIFQSPHGIHHHYCPLALLEFKPGQSPWKVLSDCRSIFPPLTELTNLFYISGDGQEAMPLTNHNELRKPLQVGVSNGQWPVKGAQVKFAIYDGSAGSLSSTPLNVEVSSGTGEVTVLTDEHGVAECKWTLDTNITYLSQQVEATLLDAAGKPFHIPIRFTANLSVAQEVFYDPKGCVNLQKVNNVQDALERLSKLTTITYLGGDGQDAVPGEWLPKPLEVRVVSKCGPVAGVKVVFTPEGGGQVSNTTGGAAASTVGVFTDTNGIAGCKWLPENNLDNPVQELTAALEIAGKNSPPLQEPKSIRFTANLRLGGGVCCTVTVGDGTNSIGDFQSIEDALKSTKLANGGKICVLQGVHIANAILPGYANIQIIGCGENTIVHPRPDRSTAPIFYIENSRNIRLENMTLVTATGTAIQVIDGHYVGELYLDSKEISIMDNRIIAWKHAVDITVNNEIAGSNDVRISSNQIYLLDNNKGKTAISCEADDILIEGNRIKVVPKPGSSNNFAALWQDPQSVYKKSYPDIAQIILKFLEYVRQINITEETQFAAEGGIQIGATSEHVKIIDNEIVGGSRHGIIFGKETKGFFSEISIERNEIRYMGLAGIGVINLDESLNIEDLTIYRNIIEKCLRQIPKPETPPTNDIYGAITLAYCGNNLTILENRIVNNGKSYMYPICGIYILYGENIDISRNRILNNGPLQPLGTNEQLIKGKRGGIVIEECISFEYKKLDDTDLDFSGKFGIPALKVHDNIVTQPLGQALWVSAKGPVSVVNNQFTTQDIDSAARGSNQAAAVYIYNSGVSQNLLGLFWYSLKTFLKTRKIKLFDFDGKFLIIENILVALFNTILGRYYFSGGNVMFHNNQTTLELRGKDLADQSGFASDYDFGFCSQFIFSFDDVSFIGNQSDCNFFIDLLFTNTAIFAISTRTSNNRFKEGMIFSLLSLFSMAIANNNTNNQAAHCLLALGSSDYRVNTGNVVLFDQLCSWLVNYFEKNYG